MNALGTVCAAVAAALLVGACATVSVVEAPDALNGQDLDTALALYGRFEDRLEIGGKTYYVWRRSVEVEGKHLACELRAEVAYRSLIRDTLLEGFAGACAQFSVRYTAMPDSGEDAAPATPEAALKTASGCKGCRPVGSPTTTAERED